MRSCKTCDKKFEPVHKRNWYCCKSCWNKSSKHRNYQRQYQSTKKYKKYAHNYYLEHKQEKVAYYKKRWKSKEYKLTARKSRLKRKYGITPIVYDKMFENQNGVCAICGKKETKHDRYGNIKNLQVDHNHKTGKIRGLLCFMCNAGVGMFDDCIENLRNAIHYLNPMEKIR